MSTNAQSVALQLETVRRFLPSWFEKNNKFYSLTRKMKAEDQSSRELRFPIELRPGGKVRAGSFDLGEVGGGSGTQYDFATITPQDSWIVWQFSLKSKISTDKPEKAVKSIVNRAVVDCMSEFKSMKDKHYHTSGNGVLATVTNVAGNVITVGGPNYEQLLRANGAFVMQNAAQTTTRTTANLNNEFNIVGGLNPTTHTFTVDTAPTGAAATDVICIAGLTTPAPVGPFGYPYHHNAAATGTWQNLNRANYPEVLTPNVNASGGALTMTQVLRLTTLIELALSGDALDEPGWVWYGHPKVQYQYAAQQQLYYSLELTESTGNRQVDLGMQRRKQKQLEGYPMMTNPNADPTRLDLIKTDNFVRGVSMDVDFVDFETGHKMHPVLGSFGYKFGTQFILGLSEQIGCENPRLGGYISNLVVPF